jgi:hypothetical protein
MELDAAALLIFQEKVMASPSASEAEAFKTIFAPGAMEFPVAAGVCDPQTGGLFLTTLHVFVELPEVAVKVLMPGFNRLESSDSVVPVELNAFPFKENFTLHVEEERPTVKAVRVPAVFETFVTLSIEGFVVVTVQSVASCGTTPRGAKSLPPFEQAVRAVAEIAAQKKKYVETSQIFLQKIFMILRAFKFLNSFFIDIMDFPVGYFLRSLQSCVKIRTFVESLFPSITFRQSECKEAYMSVAGRLFGF